MNSNTYDLHRWVRLAVMGCLVATTAWGQANGRNEASVASTFEGFTTASRDVLISSGEMGRLVDVPVDIGQIVRAGDVIAKLDDTVQASGLAVAEVQAAMTGELLAAKATREVQRDRVRQLTSLAANAMAGPEELRRAELDLKIAESRVVSAEEQLQLRRAEADRLRLQLNLRTIRAPFDGVVAERFLTEGASIIPSDPTIARLVRTDVLHGVFNIPATILGTIKRDDPVQLYLRSARRTVDGFVDVIGPVIDAESGTVPVRVRVENADRALWAGDRCTMRLMKPTDAGAPQTLTGQDARGRRNEPANPAANATPDDSAAYRHHQYRIDSDRTRVAGQQEVRR